jgi:hypothetical protein
VLLLGDRGRGRGRRLGGVVLTPAKDAVASPADGDEPPYERPEAEHQPAAAHELRDARASTGGCSLLHLDLGSRAAAP